MPPSTRRRRNIIVLGILFAAVINAQWVITHLSQVDPPKQQIQTHDSVIGVAPVELILVQENRVESKHFSQTNQTQISPLSSEQPKNDPSQTSTFSNRSEAHRSHSQQLATKDPTSDSSYVRTISFEMKEGFLFNNTFSPHTTCPPDEKRYPLHAEMREARGVLDFTTHISTNLNILLMGDSVGIQISQGLEEAVGATYNNRAVYRYAWDAHEGLHISAPVRGGGVVAGWRITHFLRRSGENKLLPNIPGGGWVRSDVVTLLNHTYVDRSGTPRKVESFDVLIFRIPHGWFGLDEVTERNMNSTVELASELFGIKNVVFLSLPFINNILSTEDLRLLREKNEVIRNFAENWRSGTFGVDRILVLDFGTLGDQLTEWNARILGMNMTDENWIMEPLRCCPHKGYRRHIAQVCGELVRRNAKRCNKNAVSRDGIHWCIEVIGGRLFAGLACLLACFHYGETGKGRQTNFRTCETNCNGLYMSLTPISY